jgi:hypothetical protein
MVDHRQFLRKALQCTVSIFDEEYTHVGVMADYSKTGIMIAGYKPIAVGSIFKFTIIDLPGNSGNKRSGTIEAQCMWCEKINITQFGIGFKLLTQDESAKKMFKSYDAAHAL